MPEQQDKYFVGFSNLQVSKEEWERIFGKPEDVKVKKGKVPREDFTNGGILGKNRGWV